MERNKTWGKQQCMNKSNTALDGGKERNTIQYGGIQQDIDTLLQAGA